MDPRPTVRRAELSPRELGRAVSDGPARPVSPVAAPPSSTGSRGEPVRPAARPAPPGPGPGRRRRPPARPCIALPIALRPSGPDRVGEHRDRPAAHPGRLLAKGRQCGLDVGRHRDVVEPDEADVRGLPQPGVGLGASATDPGQDATDGGGRHAGATSDVGDRGRRRRLRSAGSRPSSGRCRRRLRVERSGRPRRPPRDEPAF